MIVGNVMRAMKVEVTAVNGDGEKFTRQLSGMEAVCLQHEMDHLAGKLFIDRLSFFRKFRLRSELRRREKLFQAVA